MAESIIIISEKPDAALRIADALSEGRMMVKSSYGVNYYEFERGGKKHIVVSAVGHLFGLKQKTRGAEFPVFDAVWVPTFKSTKKAAFTERYFRTLEDIAQTPDVELVSACDYDNEGSLIAEKIIRLIFKKEDAGRMKFSTLTRQDLISAYDNMSPHLDFNNISAGEIRHYLDWMYGINTSRALMSAIKKGSKRFSILSAGRVQAPTLVILSDRESEIKEFKPVPYWQLQLTAVADGNEIVALHEEDKIWDRPKAEKILSECQGKPALVDSIESEKYKQSPPAPFNITSLQTEAYRLFGCSPQQTMSIAQSLYTRAFISYPRTSSEKLPPQIGYRQILEALSKIEKYKPMCKALLALKSLRPTEGKLSDAAHEAIHPTVEPPQDIGKLRLPEQKIYDLICRRYFSVFAEPALKESIKVVIKVGIHNFIANSRRTLEKGWLRFYGPYVRGEDIFLPEIDEGAELEVNKLDMLNCETKPPSRFSQASIIKEMEKRGLGTRATRSNILQTLYDRNYIESRSIQVTDLGTKIASVIKKYVPDFADEQLTRTFEEELEGIMEGKDERENILNNAKKAIIKICEEFKQHEDVIGKELGEAIVKTEDEKATLGSCPVCKSGILKVLYSPLTKKSFVGCSSYSRCKVCGFTKPACKCPCPICGQPKGKCKCVWKDKQWTPSCQAIYPLPHGAAVYKTDSVCDKCSTPIIKVYRGGRKPFSMCLDTKCETKADWGKPKTRKTRKIVKI
ncbi:MAG: DNA topoisomerase I [Candidatus Aenigmatarchaeota archaeon]